MQEEFPSPLSKAKLIQLGQKEEKRYGFPKSMNFDSGGVKKITQKVAFEKSQQPL